MKGRVAVAVLGMKSCNDYPKALRTHILRLLGLKTILYKVLGHFEP